MIVALAVLPGCGGAAHRQALVVASVGDRGISKQDLEGWMKVSAPGNFVPDPPRYTACVAGKNLPPLQSLRAHAARECAQEYASLKVEALAFLIRCEWLVAEAQRRRLVAAPAQVEKRVVTEGRLLEQEGATARDVELQVEAKLAASVLRRRLPASASKITRAQAASYYKLHHQHFESPERRYFQIAEGLTREEANRFLAEARRGVNVSAASPFFTEIFPRTSIATATGEYKPLREAIFAATPHRMSGPEPLDGALTVFEVTKVTPARPRSFDRVASTIKRQLELHQRTQLLPTGLLSSLRARWLASTDCRPGYVVQQCRQFAGEPTMEEAPGFR